MKDINKHSFTDLLRDLITYQQNTIETYKLIVMFQTILIGILLCLLANPDL